MWRSSMSIWVSTLRILVQYWAIWLFGLIQLSVSFICSFSVLCYSHSRTHYLIVLYLLDKDHTMLFCLILLLRCLYLVSALGWMYVTWCYYRKSIWHHAKQLRPNEAVTWSAMWLSISLMSWWLIYHQWRMSSYSDRMIPVAHQVWQSGLCDFVCLIAIWCHFNCSCGSWSIVRYFLFIWWSHLWYYQVCSSATPPPW